MRGRDAAPAMRRWSGGGKLLVALGALAAVAIIGSPKPGEDTWARTELAAFPSGEALPTLRMGHAQLAADLAWLRAIQYYGEHRRSDHRYPYAGHIFRVITGLDPGFEHAYVFGALVLAEDAGLAGEARALLTEGMAARPYSWWLVFERGFLDWVHREDIESAAKDMAAASRLPGAPSWVSRFAAHCNETVGKRAFAMALWKQVAEQTHNPRIRDIALRALERLSENGGE